MTEAASPTPALHPRPLAVETARPRRRWSGGRVAAVVAIVIALLWTLLPLYWMLSTSFKSQLEATRLDPTAIPQSATLDNYKGLVTGSLPFTTFLLNSIVTSLIAAVVCVVLSTFAAYALSRARWKLRGATSYTILAMRMLPMVVLIGPLYLLLLRTHLLNSYVGLILGYTTFGLPFATWMLKGFMDAVPREIEEAARVDGYPRVQILLRVVVPLILPGLFTTGTFVFMDSWNNLIYPITLITDIGKQTLPGGLLLSFTGQFKTDWGGMMAASTITSIPVLVGFFLIQRSMVRGLTAGALAGQ
jgi:ABC-type glycerol-3-phosphate transport system permease component